MATDIKKAMTILSNKAESFKKSEVEALTETLKNVSVNEMTSDKDKESFLKVAVLVKDLKGRLKKAIGALDEKHKPGVKKLEAELAKAKDEYKSAVEPFKDANRELDRIDDEARDAISAYTTAQIEAANKVAAPDTADGEPVFMPKASDAATHAISKGGHDLNYTTRRVVKVIDINQVPGDYCNWVADADTVKASLEKLGVRNPLIQVQADGTLMVKVKPLDLPENLRRRDTVKDAVILGLGGCPGVEIKDEYRAMVK